MKKLGKMLAILLSVIMAVSCLPVAFAAETHACDKDDDCLVCYIAELINSLPAAEEITAENAAKVTDTLHAIDCVKFDLSDAEYEELMTLVAAEESDIGGMAVPKAYTQALNAIVNLEEGCELYISKFAVVDGIDNYDLSQSVVAFEITGENGYAATVSLKDAVQGVFTLNEAQAQYVDFNTATLATFEGFYAMEETGWTYSYRLPAGTYTIREITDSMIINGKEYSGFDVSCNGEDANGGYTFTLKDGSVSTLMVSNTYDPFTLFYDANGGEGWMELQEIAPNGRVEVLENGFVKDGYAFAGWNTEADGSGETYQPGEIAIFYDYMTLYAQWKECTDHDWENGKCNDCGKECAHESCDAVITSRPESSDGITWTDGKKTYTCGDCGYEYTEDVERADYSEYIKAALEFAKLVATEGLTDAAKANIAIEYNNLGELQQNLVVDEQKIVDDYTDKLNALIEKIKAGIADGSYLKADYTELDAAIKELEKVLDENKALITKDAETALEEAIEKAKSTDKDLTKSAEDKEILDAAVEAAKNAATLDDGDYKADTSEAEALIAEIETNGIKDEALKAEFEEIKADVEKIKADENASKAEYQKTVDEYVERLTEIKNSGDNAVEDDFRCSMCPTYEKFKDITGVGFLITIIHFFIHFANYIAFVS